MQAEKQQTIAKLEGKKAESQRAIEKEEITSTEFPEGGNTTYTKGPLTSQRGERLTVYENVVWSPRFKFRGQ